MTKVFKNVSGLFRGFKPGLDPAFMHYAPHWYARPQLESRTTDAVRPAWLATRGVLVQWEPIR